MAILTSKSNRFARTLNYTMPEYRAASPSRHKTRIEMVVPATHNRAPEKKGGRQEDRR